MTFAILSRIWSIRIASLQTITKHRCTTWWWWWWGCVGRGGGWENGVKKTPDRRLGGGRKGATWAAAHPFPPAIEITWFFEENAHDSGNDTWQKTLRNNAVGMISQIHKQSFYFLWIARPGVNGQSGFLTMRELPPYKLYRVNCAICIHCWYETLSLSTHRKTLLSSVWTAAISFFTGLSF